MSDPLSLVRLATQKGTQVLERNEEYHFGTRSYGIKTETCFRRTISKAKTEYYTLKDVIFYIQHSEMDLKEYRRAVIREKCQPVLEADKGPLMSYLKGEVASVPQMDAEKAAKVVAEANLKMSTSTKSSEPSSREKKPKAQKPSKAEDDMDVVVPTKESQIDSAKAEARKRMLFYDKETDMRVGSDEYVMASQQDIKRSKQELTASRSGEVAVADRVSVMRNAKVDFTFALKSFNDHVL